MIGDKVADIPEVDEHRRCDNITYSESFDGFGVTWGGSSIG